MGWGGSPAIGHPPGEAVASHSPSGVDYITHRRRKQGQGRQPQPWTWQECALGVLFNRVGVAGL